MRTILAVPMHTPTHTTSVAQDKTLDSTAPHLVGWSKRLCRGQITLGGDNHPMRRTEPSLSQELDAQPSPGGLSQLTSAAATLLLLALCAASGLVNSTGTQHMWAVMQQPQDQTGPTSSRPFAGADGWWLWRHHKVLLGRLRLGRVGTERQRRVRVMLARPCGKLAGAGQPPQPDACCRAHWPACHATIAANGPGGGDCRARCSCTCQLGGPELEARARHSTDLQLRVRHLWQQRFKRRHSCKVC